MSLLTVSFDVLVHWNPTKVILSAKLNRKSSIFKLNMDIWMIYRESGHFSIVNREVMTVVDPVVRKTPRKNSMNDGHMKKPVTPPPPPPKILSNEEMF